MPNVPAGKLRNVSGLCAGKSPRPSGLAEPPKTRTAPRRRLLVVSAYPDLDTWLVPPIRNVHLVALEADCGARECDLFDVDVPLHKVLELVAWAKSVGIPHEEQPVGCLCENFLWPKGAKGFTLPYVQPDNELFG